MPCRVRKPLWSPIRSRRVAAATGLRFQTRLVLTVLVGGLPAVLVASLLLLDAAWPRPVRAALAAVVLIGWLLSAYLVRRRVVFPLQTLANLLEALREGDYTLRGRYARRGDALGEVVHEVNALGAMLRSHRLTALESHALLEKVLGALDAAVFAFDRDDRLRLVNRAGAELLGRAADELLGLRAADVSLDRYLQGEGARTVMHAFPARTGRWEISMRGFREGGVSQRLLVVTDLSRALREEERRAWHRLIRVIGHEINNSLTPIKSLAGTLRDVVADVPAGDDLPVRQEVEAGLAVIADRADSLGRFVATYSQLARMPPPQLSSLDLRPVLERIAALGFARPVDVAGVEDLEVTADPAQLEQLFINLIKNAAEAAAATAGRVTVSARHHNGWIRVEIVDDGEGVANPENLFVPFFTTKRTGTGIGLVLSRQIAEAHGGSLELTNRNDAPGCVATLTLPASA